MTATQNRIDAKWIRDYIDRKILEASVTANSGEISSQIAAQITGYLQKAGGTMTGNLTLVGDPTASLHPVTLQYFNANIPAGGAFSYVDTADITGSAATSFTASGLNLSTAEEYVVRYTLVSNTASTANVSLYFNSDTTASNYRRETQNRFSAGAGSNDGIATEQRGSGDTVGFFYIRQDSNGYPRTLSFAQSGAITNVFGMRIAHIWQDTSNVTSLTLSSSVSSSLGVGSYMDFFKRVAA